MDVVIRPDATFSVVDVHPVTASPAPTAISAETPSDVRSAMADLNSAIPASQPTPASGAAFLKGAQQLAQAIGVSPTAVTFEAPASHPQIVTTGPLAVVTHTNGNLVLVQPIKLSSDESAYHVQGRMGNLSNTLQAEIQSRLASSDSPGFLTGNPELIVESRVDQEKGFQILSISLAPTETSKSAVLLWKAEPARATSSASKPGGVLRSLPVRAAGVAPASRALIKTVFGEKAGQASFQNTQPLSVRFQSAAKTDLAVRWTATNDAVRESFVFVGKPVEFTDTIRAAIEAQLAEQKTVIKKNADVQVEFEVDTSLEAPKVEITDVGPPPRELAQKQAEKMGLSSNDYLLVDIGARFLIVVDRGQSISIVGKNETVRLKSTDGNVVVVANPRQTKQDTSVLLMLSRLAIKNNWANLVRLAGENIDGTVEAALHDNPNSEQFLLRYNSADKTSFVIRPLNPATATITKPISSKP